MRCSAYPYPVPSVLEEQGGHKLEPSSNAGRCDIPNPAAGTPPPPCGAWGGRNLDIGGRDTVPEPDDKFGDLLDVDHVLGVLLPRVEDLGAARDLERLLALHQLLVGNHVPRSGGRETRVGLLDPADVVDALVHGADVLLDVLDGVRIWSQTIAGEGREGNSE